MTAVKDARRLCVNGGRFGNCYAVAIGITFDGVAGKSPINGLFLREIKNLKIPTVLTCIF